MLKFFYTGSDIQKLNTQNVSAMNNKHKNFLCFGLLKKKIGAKKATHENSETRKFPKLQQ